MRPVVAAAFAEVMLVISRANEGVHRLEMVEGYK